MPSTRPIPLHDGHTIPQLGFGTSPMTVDEAEDACATALSVGYRHIDTAASYGNEEGVGRALAASGLRREEYFLTTKLGNDDHARGAVREAMEASLTRLGLDHVDLYLIHWPMPMVGRFVEVWEAIAELKAEGLTRSVGVSNFLPEHLDTLQDETGITPVVNQFELHPTEQPEDTINYCHDNNIAVVGYAPLGVAKDLRHPTITTAAEQLGATPAQVVLAWHLARGFVAIPKSVTPKRIQENFDAQNVRLSSEVLEAIDSMHTGRDKVWGDPLEVHPDYRWF